MRIHETELVRRARDGDETAFEALFREYQSTMYRVALHFTGAPELAADVTQDAFVRAWERLPRLRDDRAFGGWIRAILLNLVRDSYRVHRDQVSLEDDPRGAESYASDEPTPADGVARGQLEDSVRRAVMSLPEHQRAVVVMHHLEAMSIEDIADALGLKKGTVLSRLSRGRKMLQKKLAGKL